MSRPSSGDLPPTPPLAPWSTPAAGIPAPATPSPFAAGPAPAPSPATKAGPTPLGVIYALKRRWVLATFIGALAATLAAVAVWLVMPSGKHQAQALIVLRPPSPTAQARGGEDFEAFRRSQMYLLKTRDLINRTLAEAAVASLDTVKHSDDPAQAIEDRLLISVPAPNMLLVTLAGDNPDDLKVILENMVRKHLDDSTVNERKAREEEIRKLERSVERFRAEITATENNIRRRAEQSGITGASDADTRAAQTQNIIVTLDAELFATEKEYHELNARIESLKKKLAATKFEVSPIDIAQFVDAHELVAPLLRQQNEKKFALDRAKTTAGQFDPKTPPPTVAELDATVASLETQIAQKRKDVEPLVQKALATHGRQMFERNLAELEEKRDAVKTMLDFRKEYRKQFQNRIANVARDGVDIRGLLEDLKPMKDHLAKTQAQLLQLQLEKQEDPRVALRGQVDVKQNANLKQKTLIAVGAAVIAFFLALAIVGFLEWRTRRIDSVDQVVGDLGMRVIGTVPAFPTRAGLKAAEVAGNANWRFVLNESINSTRTMLLHTARHQSMQVVMVTSATQGEGKTSLASQLGTSMATAGMRTLIVDCDLRNPSIHKLFDLGLSPGVSEVLCGESDVTDATQPTGVPNLWAIPAGQCSARVITALAQGHPLETLFNRLRGQYDFIIVDCCPVLPVADALLIGQHVDGVVFSIMQDVSQVPKVVTASEKLTQLNIPLVGAVVNGIQQSTYSYGYNYVKQLPA